MAGYSTQIMYDSALDYRSEISDTLGRNFNVVYHHLDNVMRLPGRKPGTKLVWPIPSRMEQKISIWKLEQDSQDQREDLSTVPHGCRSFKHGYFS